VINGGTTIMLPNETFTLAYFEYNDNFDRFMSGRYVRSTSSAQR
jgi:hypothetical protein